MESVDRRMHDKVDGGSTCTTERTKNMNVVEKGKGQVYEKVRCTSDQKKRSE